MDVAISQSNGATLASSTPLLYSFSPLSVYSNALFLSSLPIDFMSHFHIKEGGGEGRVK
jgi:hypothetical protein